MSPRRQSRRRALGQHYLADQSVVDVMVALAKIGSHDRVLEIGTGRGVLTRGLAGLSDNFEAFELDEANYLATKKLGLRGLSLHLGDAFSSPSEFDVLVSSLPYSESSNFVEWLSGRHYERAVVLLQRDFVDKLLAGPGEDGYRAISVISQLSSSVRLELEVARGCFDPPPKVSSAVVVITPVSVLSPRDTRLVKMLFSQRRRKLRGALKQLGLKSQSDDLRLLDSRVEGLSPADFQNLLRRLEGDV